ncbi:MAG: transcriptional regulator [Nitrosopumilus sp.]|jgi:predicted DNA-binding transcriptional regulator|nr:transcriptional regulator [Nitrosopumilus sp.]MBT4216025.1 transcriptional regulator [Nitrosopumilus sp.]MBT4550585.1 transcriptional regulator [Nitrosopumilus sp.]
MDKRRSLGVLLFVLCIGTFFVYAYLLMLSEWSPIVLQLSVLMAVGGILAMIAWIGYVVATKQPTSATITSSDDSPI